jgi:hypothetical protein
MSNFQKLSDLPILDLYSELNVLLKNNTLRWGINNQICLNTIDSQLDNFLLGEGSLTHDWARAETIIDQYGNEKIEIPLFKVPYTEEQFTSLCSQFKNTLFEIVYNELKLRYNLGRVRIMKTKPKTCLSWHVDNTDRIHYPIKTQEECFMVIESEIKHLELCNWWYTKTQVPHTAFNASKEDRIHLVAVVLDK